MEGNTGTRPDLVTLQQDSEKSKVIAIANP